MPKPKMIDVSQLTPNERKRLEKILVPRDTKLSLKFKAASVEAWRAAAEREEVSLTDWIERGLDKLDNGK